MRICLLLALLAVGAITTATAQALRTFATAEEAAQALIRIVKADNADELNALLGPDARELADADPAAAQRRYAQEGHDGTPAGLYAPRIRSDPGKHNGLYWPVAEGDTRSPLGDLVAEAARDGSLDPNGPAPMPFHGYYFRILTAQGAAARGGAQSYLVNGRLSGGFALVAWPTSYDVTGVMTFTINHAGVLYEKDLGAKTESVARAMTRYNPDSSWRRVADEAP